MALIFSLFSEHVVGIYLNINDLDNVVIFEMATYFIALASLFQFFYSIQTVAIGYEVGSQDILPTANSWTFVLAAISVA